MLIAWKNDQKTEDLNQESKAVTSSWNDRKNSILIIIKLDFLLEDN